MIRDMLSACDINHDGQITYDEFVKFCDQTEKELWTLFQSIDRDHNGNLDKAELSQAFDRAGVGVSNARLDRFFSYIDKNHDGKIDFPEWRGMSQSSRYRVPMGYVGKCMTDGENLLHSQTSSSSFPLTPRA